MKKAADSFMDSSRARHDLQGDEMENQRRTKSDSKQQATKNHMTKRPKAYEFSLKKKKKKEGWGENLPAMRETRVRSLGWKDPLEKGMATHSSILASRIPQTEKPGGLQSVRSQRVDMTEQLTLSLPFN